MRSIKWSVGSTVRESLVAGRARVGGTKQAVLVLAPTPSRLRPCSSTPRFSAPASVLPAEAGEGVGELRARARVAGLPEMPTLTKLRPMVASGSVRKAARHAAACCFAIALVLGAGHTCLFTTPGGNLMNRCEFESRTLGQERKEICSNVVEVVYNRDPAATSSIQTKQRLIKERPILIGETTDIPLIFRPLWFLLRRSSFFGARASKPLGSNSNDILVSRVGT